MPPLDESTESTRRIVASYPTYEQAQHAVDFLSDQKFPVKRVSIVAEGLRMVEQVTGRRNYGIAALYGAISGAVVGAFFGFFFGLWSWITPLISALNLMFYGLIYGAIVGALIGLVGHALTRGRRDFSSVTGIDANQYNVMVDAEVAEEAARLLDRFRPQPPPERARATVPGLRVDTDTTIPAR